MSKLVTGTVYDLYVRCCAKMCTSPQAAFPFVHSVLLPLSHCSLAALFESFLAALWLMRCEFQPLITWHCWQSFPPSIFTALPVWVPVAVNWIYDNFNLNSWDCKQCSVLYIDWFHNEFTRFDSVISYSLIVFAVIEGPHAFWDLTEFIEVSFLSVTVIVAFMF